MPRVYERLKVVDAWTGVEVPLRKERQIDLITFVHSCYQKSRCTIFKTHLQIHIFVLDAESTHTHAFFSSSSQEKCSTINFNSQSSYSVT